MAIVITYGSYTFDSETTVVPISRRASYNDENELWQTEQAFRVRTVLQATTPAAVLSAETTLVNALVPGGTFTVTVGGSTTVHTVADCQIRSISFPESTGPEYANRRTVEAEIIGYEYEDLATDLIEFQESLSIATIGDSRIAVPTLEGRPRIFNGIEHPLNTAIQQGSAAGRTAYPAPPGALFPGFTIRPNDEPSAATFTARRVGNGTIIYVTTWTYEFVSAYPFNGVPNTWL